MSDQCPECFGPPKSMCFNTRCPYRQRQQLDDLDQLTAESHPDPLEEMAAIGMWLLATGNERGFTAIDECRLDEYRDLQNTQAAFLQGTGRL